MFTLPQLVVGGLGRTRWIGSSSKTHSLGLVNRGDWTLKKMMQIWFLCFSWGRRELRVKKKVQLKSGLALLQKLSEIILHLNGYLWKIENHWFQDRQIVVWFLVIETHRYETMLQFYIHKSICKLNVTSRIKKIGSNVNRYNEQLNIPKKTQRLKYAK